MSSIQAALLSQPLPLSETSGSHSFKPKATQQSPDKVAKDFESVFASMMLKEMRKSLEPGSLFGDDSSDVYGGMFDQFMGQHMSESGGLGLASMIRQALEKSASLGQTTPTATPTPTVSAPTLK